MHTNLKNSLLKPMFLMFLLTGIFGKIIAQDYSKAQLKSEKAFLKELKKKNVHNALMAISAPDAPLGCDYSGGNFKDGEAVSIHHPFFTASIGKTFTATAIAVLAEEQKLNFTDKISYYLPDSVMHQLHVFEGMDYSNQITIAQLLQHTSGLPDYFEGKTIDGSPNGMELLFSDTARFWQPMELIQLAKIHMTPNFAPGTGYLYTDTEYILLGLIIEKISGMPLHDFFIKQFFEPLQMQHTYMYKRSEPLKKTLPMTEVYVDTFDATHLTSLTADWAGGGLVSTAGDLLIFQKALMQEKIVSQEILTQMQNWTPESKGFYYGFGLRKIELRELFPTLPKLSLIGHSGSTGSFMYYCPELNVYMAGTLNQTEEVKSSVVLMVKVLAELQRELKK